MSKQWLAWVASASAWACAAAALSVTVPSAAAAEGEVGAKAEQALQRSEYPEGVSVKVTRSNCAIDFTYAISRDREAITMVFGKHFLNLERPSLLCHIGIDYQFPAGWRFARPSAVARGFHRLLEGQSSVFVVRTRLDRGDFVSQPLVTRGPVEDNFQADLAGGEEVGEAFTGCGATSAHIDVDLIGGFFYAPLRDPSDAPVGTIDSIDTEIDWQRCP